MTSDMVFGKNWYKSLIGRMNDAELSRELSRKYKWMHELIEHPALVEVTRTNIALILNEFKRRKRLKANGK